ncbi:MAG: PSD1 domain-containing protein [Verrucomicrobiales bacterium]|nr:PSD1 domain-containing protein [Verrucomicrobiales bacterium]MCP5526191.1 PSD1 domain-containing protein [Verrucomicrobiales bacterium]
MRLHRTIERFRPECLRGRRAGVVPGFVGGLLFAAGCLPATGGTEAAAAAADAFFERRIRPVLADNCYQCHSPAAGKVRGGLTVDSRAGLLAGGDTGPAIQPGDPASSLLLRAVGYGDPDLQMPPRSRLADRQIEDLTQWIQLGAPWPDSDGAVAAVRSDDGFDLEARRREHWSWQPLRAVAPPPVEDAAWAAHPVDRFVRAGLEAAGLSPAEEADRRTLLRRLHFDLVGLPPSVAEVESFVADPSPDAWERRVDALLASPRYGERWARHWLDLVRYAETLGHEFDYARHNAWRYRDYVIRALNADVPYDWFVREHIAGDLLPEPRRNPADGSNESVIGTAFWWFGQQTHSPVDVRQHQADFVDNQIDVLSKTFLGLTVSCARCHDHKFDAISTRDFYSLFGVAAGSRYAQKAINAPILSAEEAGELESARTRLRRAVAAAARSMAGRLASELLSVGAAGESPTVIDEVRAKAWRGFLEHPARTNRADPWHLWRTFSRQGSIAAADWDALGKVTNADGAEPLAGRRFPDWLVEGETDPGRATVPGDFLVGEWKRPVAGLATQPGWHSARLSRALEGAIRSPTFTLTNRYLHVRAAGRDTRLNVVVENFTLIRDPIYGRLKLNFDTDEPRWWTIDLDMWQGDRVYVEVLDVAAPDPADGGHASGYGAGGYVDLIEVRLSDEARPPEAPAWAAADVLGSAAPASLEDLAVRYQHAVLAALDRWADTGRLAPAEALLLDGLFRAGLLGGETGVRAGVRRSVERAFSAWEAIEKTVAHPVYVPGMTDGNGVDQPVMIRGNPRRPGEPAPRRFLTALGGLDDEPFGAGSGRLALAGAVTAPDNPFPARVMVNRIWLHLFGRGIVPTPDDFGVLGQPPSHPELLDWLAARFRDEAHWSVKSMIRLLVTSRAYRMSSRIVDPVAEERDPDNRLLHRMAVRRLEGEALRDAILALSGRLDLATGGPSVPTHLTDFMDGRGRPGQSGPLDGNGRRSIYLEVRNNFLSPMMRTFDTPIPFTTIGRRTQSNVPAQSLILMNDPFVVGQAALWAERLCAEPATPLRERVRRAYLEVFSRPPTAGEIERAGRFLDEQKATRTEPLAETGAAAEPIWQDLCHVLLNTKEFLYLD